MRLALQIISGAVIALTLGVLVILTVLGSPGAISTAVKGTGLMPGGQGYILIQLGVGLIAGCLALFCLFRSPGKPLRTVASLAALLAIVVSLGDVFWLPVIVVVQSSFFLRFQYRTRSSSKDAG